jgi:predicted dienelactone hydrolase
MTILSARFFPPRLCLALMLFVMPAVSRAQTVSGVGFSTIKIHDPVNGGTTTGYVFYPSAQASGVTSLGPYELHATADAPAIPGSKPLVVISHGHGGSDLGHHDLAVYLASHGFVVATLEQPKDNFHDMSGTGTAAVLAGRPIQVKATISYLLDDPHWSKLIDPARIGVAGFSAGGYTALMIVGAVPRFDLFVSYCERHPQDAEVCASLEKLQAEGTAKAGLATLQSSLERWGNPADSRVKAAFLMAPLGLVFDKAGLANVDRPVFLYYGQNDPVLLPDENALHLAPLMRTLAGTRMIPNAGHYVFLAPCSPQLLKEAPDICRDPAGVNRGQVHAQIDADALAFFRKMLGAESH